jgi:hypothetical protein
MSAQGYVASGGVIFAREHTPMTMERARWAVTVHRLNASYQLTEGEERTLAARIALAKVEMGLADELEAAIASINQPMEQAA